MDKIIIKNARFLCTVGINKAERKEKKEIILDVEIYFDTRNLADSIENTINYAEVYKKIKEVIEHKEYHLIETIAHDVADAILESFDTNKVKLVVKKPSALANAEYAAVAITREKR